MTPGPFDNEVLHEPDDAVWSASFIGRYVTWLREGGIVDVDDYTSLWDWSVSHPAEFWGSVRDYFELPIHGEETVLDLGSDSPTGLPGAKWFPGATLNYAARALAGVGRRDDDPALIAHSQTRGPVEWTWAELRSETARLRRGLAALGVGPGETVAAYAPNIPETIAAFLATASLGGIWTSCAPEFGTRSVLDRLRQISPKVLIAIDGYRYGSRTIDRSAEVAAIRDGLDGLVATIHLPYLDADVPTPVGTLCWSDLDGPEDPGTLPVAFDHPLYVLYSSGTTGLPKPIVHGHGGILIEHVKALALHGDVGPTDRFFWFTTTGWMMWNYLVSGLAVGATLVLFDGDPGSPDLDVLWELAEETRMTVFGVSAPFLDACRHRGLHPSQDHDLTAVRSVGSTGAPLVADGFRWVYEEVGDVLLGSISGGTDVCTAFVGAVPIRAVQAGVIPCRYLGVKVEAFDPVGQSLVGVEGDLVVTVPMPSMPVGLWGDSDGSRYRSSYFSKYPGVWCHGDWITIAADGRCVISGRSDATLNRGGVRLGTADFYAVVEGLSGVADSLVVHLEDSEGGPGQLIIFVVTSDGADVDGELGDRIRAALRTELSPRHSPDRIVPVPAIPRTLSGKKLEVPVKRILRGTPVEEALTPGALADPGAIDALVEFAAKVDGRTD